MSIKIEHLDYVYSQGTAYEKKALNNINLEIPDGQFVGIIGHTGSGKSTLVQHLNGLMKATDGTIYFNGENIYAQGYSMKELRSKVGLVFQYPEYQLFEIDVFTDVCFGPKNLGLPIEEVEKRATEALRQVGLKEKYYKKSPFELSGGQKRRVAIAGILAMQPEVLILDEPTAGLDPKGRDDILDQIAELQKQRNITVVLVSHSMEDIAKYVDRIIVMEKGKVRFDDAPKKVFEHYKELECIGLAAPQVTYVMQELKNRGMNVDTHATTIEEAVASIMSYEEGRGRK
ncbi:MAG: energy-coupling factor transporter ATPase [Eubacteriales bacterium]|nr:energy-coupling factor transporter ATPase [Eubacteriales bacterium]